MNRPYEGLFITIEGGEGAGKSTLNKELGEALTKKGYQVLSTREPGGTPFSERIRELILEDKDDIKICDRAEVMLFLAARVQHIEEVILPKLRAGYVVICERFSDSTIAYQGAARHLGVEEVANLCKLSTRSLEPQCTLLLDIDPQEGFKRVKESRGADLDRLEKEDLQFHIEVRQAFLHLADQHPNRIVLIDATLPQKQLLEDVLKKLEPHLLLKPTSSHA